MSDDFRTESRKNWVSHFVDDPTDAQLSLGCLQRIADATESMAKEYDRLLRDNKWLRSRAESADACSKRLARSNAALRGQITKLKNAGATP